MMKGIFPPPPLLISPRTEKKQKVSILIMSKLELEVWLYCNLQFEREKEKTDKYLGVVYPPYVQTQQI